MQLTKKKGITEIKCQTAYLSVVIIDLQCKPGNIVNTAEVLQAVNPHRSGRETRGEILLLQLFLVCVLLHQGD